MTSEREAETPVRIYRRMDGLRVELLDVQDQRAGWLGYLFRAVTAGALIYRKGALWFCERATWVEERPRKEG